MHPPAEPSSRRPAWLPLLAVAVLIVYGSLYPFHFSLPQKYLFTWSVPHTLGSLRDFLINVAMYFPLGFLLQRVLPRSPAGAALAVLFGATLSTGIEYLQSYDFSRYSSALDILMNTVGTALGAGTALVFRRRFHPGQRDWIRKAYSHPAEFWLLFVLAVSYLFPFFPRVHLAEWSQSANAFLQSPIVIPQIVFAAIEWLGARLLLTLLLNKQAVTAEFSCLVCLIPVSLFVAGQSATRQDLLGAGLAIAIGHWWRPRAGQLAPWFWLHLVGRELFPFHLAAIAQPFLWIPFASVIQMGPVATAILCRKLFLYGTAILLPEIRIWKAAAALAGLLFVLEQVQRYLPGRTPEITDATLALLAGWTVSVHFRKPTSVTSRVH